MNIEVNRVVSFRPNEYDVGVLKMIEKSHPEITDIGDLLRKALREYELARQGGGMKVLVREIWEAVVGHRHARVNELMDASRVLGGGEYSRCDNPPASE